MITISLFTCIFVLIYRSFARIYVIIFQNIIYNFLNIKKKKVPCVGG